MQAEQITLLIDFLNTVDVDAHTDVLDEPATFANWARTRGLDAGEPVEARAVRDVLRDALTGSRDLDIDIDIPIRIDPDGKPGFAPRNLAQTVVATALELAALGRWERVKLCPADDCLEAFYDASRNHSRIWCDMADCGNLAKVRNYRQRASRPQ